MANNNVWTATVNNDDDDENKIVFVSNSPLYTARAMCTLLDNVNTNNTNSFIVSLKLYVKYCTTTDLFISII
jgi:hypothetical protein